MNIYIDKIHEIIEKSKSTTIRGRSIRTSNGILQVVVSRSSEWVWVMGDCMVVVEIHENGMRLDC